MEVWGGEVVQQMGRSTYTGPPIGHFESKAHQLVKPTKRGILAR